MLMEFLAVAALVALALAGLVGLAVAGATDTPVTGVLSNLVTFFSGVLAALAYAAKGIRSSKP
jgi:hypothetical protein